MKSIGILLLGLAVPALAAAPSPQWRVADTNLAAYFARETAALAARGPAEIKSAEDWRQRAPQWRQELADMLGLMPLPERTDLRATVTGRIDYDDFTVEKVHFQSLPRLYVTANFYFPRRLTKPVPAVLYVCGHSPVISNGVSFGTKAAYQHHGIWFARNGYACLVVDTLESGEILGQHHGTYRENLWWWNSRGYSPAGVETWNAMRALDYLSTRPEVDTNRFGVTGRSGGGAYSWFITAMDDRIKAAAPTAGITDLENHVVDGCVEGHCDCMFLVNTHRWDYPQLAALAAPRPLLFCNTDADTIFPLEGVVRTHAKVRGVYEALGAGEKLGLVITPGPHKDTQELQVPVMRWFNQHLRGTNALVENAAVKLFTPQDLKVFRTLPADSINSNIALTFVPAASNAWPASKKEWPRQRDLWLAALRDKSFRAWPARIGPAVLKEESRMDWGKLLQGVEKLTAPAGATVEGATVGGPEVVHYLVAGAAGRTAQLSLELPRQCEALDVHVHSSAQRGSIQVKAGSRVASAWLNLPPLVTNSAPADVKKEIQLRRRFMLLGMTADSQRVLQIAEVIEALRRRPELSKVPLRLHARGNMAVNALYASLFAPVDELVLTELPLSHQLGPDYLNVLRVLDIPQAVVMAAERGSVKLGVADPAAWEEMRRTAVRLGFGGNVQVSARVP
jgi:hypothetical protein